MTSFTTSNGAEILHTLSAMQPEGRLVWKPRQENLAPWKVKKAQAMMIQRMAQGCSIEQVARECAMSRSHFSRAFKNATGHSPHDWLRRAKLDKAEQLLMDKRFTICQVALECGFNDQSYFTRVFRAMNGVSPRRWQMNTRVGS